MDPNNAIEVEQVTKDFRIYERSYATLKAQTMHILRRMMQRESRRTHSFKRALDNVTFNVPKGQTVAIIGHNGSGKSTLLSIMTRIYLPTHGEVRVRGRVSSLLELGLGFDGELTGIENVFFACNLRGMSKETAAERYASICEFAELEDFTMALPLRMYSTGMQARLAFSVAIHIDAETLIIDEGLAVGDITFQEKCLDYLMRVKSQGKTIFLVSHDHHFVKRFADRVVWLDSGRVKMDGPGLEVAEAYERFMLDGNPA